MSNKIHYSLILLILYSLAANAQSKKWTLKECVNYALENNISVKQTELDIKSSSIDKKSSDREFSSFTKC
jgi:outer membrane protein